MKDVIRRSRFVKDYKRCKARGLDVSLLKIIIEKLLNGEKLPVRNRDHQLSGKLKQFRECHILPDWLLIYRITEDAIILERMGSHADLLDM